MRKFINLLFILLLISVLLYTDSAKGQFNIPTPPKKIIPIQDYVGILSNIEIEKLNKKLIIYSKETSTEILVTIIQDLHGEDPNFLAIKWGEKWKIGKLHKNNGIIILLSVNDKKISIQNGYGIEPYLTDLSTIKIIKKVKPLLKNNFYYQAIDLSLQNIFQILQGKFKKENKKITSKSYYLGYIFLFLVILLIFLKIGDPSLLNTLFFINFLFPLNKNFNDDENEDDFDSFGGGGNFGGGGSSGNW